MVKIYRCYNFNIYKSVEIKNILEQLTDFLTINNYKFSDFLFCFYDIIGLYKNLNPTQKVLLKYPQLKPLSKVDEEGIAVNSISNFNYKNLSKTYSLNIINGDLFEDIMKGDYLDVITQISKNIPRPYNFVSTKFIFEGVEFFPNTSSIIIISRHKGHHKPKVYSVNINFDITPNNVILDEAKIVKKINEFFNCNSKYHSTFQILDDEQVNVLNNIKTKTDPIVEEMKKNVSHFYHLNKTITFNDETELNPKYSLSKFLKSNDYFKNYKYENINNVRYLRKSDRFNNVITIESHINPLWKTLYINVMYSGLGFEYMFLMYEFRPKSQEEFECFMDDVIIVMKEIEKDLERIAVHHDKTPEWFILL